MDGPRLSTMTDASATAFGLRLIWRGALAMTMLGLSVSMADINGRCEGAEVGGRCLRAELVGY